MPLVGNFTLGAKYIVNPLGGPGVRITRIQPDSVFLSLPIFEQPNGPTVNHDVWAHGAMTNFGKNFIEITNGAGTGRLWSSENGFTSASEEITASNFVAYTPAANKDPVAAAQPIEFPAGQAGTIMKSVNLLEGVNDRQQLLSHRMAVHIVTQAPAAGDLPPPLVSPDGASRYNLADLDMLSFSSFTVSSQAKPNPNQILEAIRHPWENQTPARPPFDRFINSAMGEKNFRRDSAKILMDACVFAASDLDRTVRDNLRAAIVVQAQDTCQALYNGSRFNFPQGDGGVQNGRKPVVVLAAMLTGDPWMLHWANRTDWAIEDAYCQYITAERLEAFGAGVAGVIDGFLPEDVGIPWWFPGPLAPQAAIKKHPTRKFWRTAYQEMFHVHMVGAHLLSHIVPGFRAAWNNDVVWDYCDRMHLRTQYKDPTSIFAHGLFSGGTNNPSKWQVSSFLSAGVVPQWNWPV